MSGPLVSIGFPVFNGEASVSAALDAVLSQDFRDLEVVIADNASTDQTGEICRRYAERDPRVRYVRNDENIGVSPNHDRVFHLSRGKYFMWMAHDVEILPGMIRECVTVMERSTPSLVYPQCEMIVDGQRTTVLAQHSIASSDLRPHRRLGFVIRRLAMVNQLYGLMRREVLAKTRLNGSYPAADYVLLAELAMLGPIVEVPQVLLRRRIDSDRGTALVYRDKRAWRTWLDPRRRRDFWAFLGVRERLALEYARGAWHVPLGPWDRVRCLFVGLVTTHWLQFLEWTRPGRHRLRLRRAVRDAPSDLRG